MFIERGDCVIADDTKSLFKISTRRIVRKLIMAWISPESDVKESTEKPVLSRAQIKDSP